MNPKPYNLSSHKSVHTVAVYGASRGRGTHKCVQTQTVRCHFCRSPSAGLAGRRNALIGCHTPKANAARPILE